MSESQRPESSLDVLPPSYVRPRTLEVGPRDAPGRGGRVKGVSVGLPCLSTVSFYRTPHTCNGTGPSPSRPSVPHPSTVRGFGTSATQNTSSLPTPPSWSPTEVLTGRGPLLRFRLAEV